MATSEPGPWGIPELHHLLAQFEDELRAAGYTEDAVRRTVEGAGSFVRWLAGRYRPGG